jgi:hypothetical protein
MVVPRQFNLLLPVHKPQLVPLHWLFFVDCWIISLFTMFLRNAKYFLLLLIRRNSEDCPFYARCHSRLDLPQSKFLEKQSFHISFPPVIRSIYCLVIREFLHEVHCVLNRLTLQYSLQVRVSGCWVNVTFHMWEHSHSPSSYKVKLARCIKLRTCIFFLERFRLGSLW